MQNRRFLPAVALAACVVCVIACDSTEPPPAATLSPANRTFDGFALGDRFASLATRAPYDKPCSTTSIEQGLYRAAVYCGDPKAAFILADDRIRAFGWTGGGYYAAKILLPVKLGDPVSRAVAVWGDPHDSFDLTAVHVDRFDGGVSVMSDHRTIVGFVFGDMPAVASAERWRLFDQLGAR